MMMRRAASTVCATAAAHAQPIFAVWPAATAAVASSSAAAPLRIATAAGRRLHTTALQQQQSQQQPSSASDNAGAELVVSAGGTLPAAARAAIPKQKVQMYHKLLRQLRSPVKGDVPDTQGDDYLLDQAESESMAAEFTGLLTANLSAGGGRSSARHRGANNGRAFGKGGRKSAEAKVWIQAALTKGAWRQQHAKHNELSARCHGSHPFMRILALTLALICFCCICLCIARACCRYR
jgi:hypothetical protein